MDKDQILLEEWKEIRETLRYFGNKRFAQFTVFIAATGFMINAFLNQIDGPALNGLRIMGLIIGILFLVMEVSAVRYWKAFVKRGEEIEDQLKTLKLMKHRPKPAGIRRFLTGTLATYSLYLIAVLFWLSSFFLK